MTPEDGELLRTFTRETPVHRVLRVLLPDEASLEAERHRIYDTRHAEVFPETADIVRQIDEAWDNGRPPPDLDATHDLVVLQVWAGYTKEGLAHIDRMKWIHKAYYERVLRIFAGRTP